jgi:hypothetical protein
MRGARRVASHKCAKRRRHGLHATHSDGPTSLDGADGTDERLSAASSRGDGGAFFCLFACDAQRLGGGKEPVKKRAALSIFETEMLSQSVSYDFFPRSIYGRLSTSYIKPK